MTNFEIGDKVKFLNAIGGGVVKKVAGGMVYVEDESGFDMPFAPNELIRMADQGKVGQVFNDDTIGRSAEQKAKEMLQTLDDLDLLLGLHKDFSFNKWVDDARSWGQTPEEKEYFEVNARTLLTTWGFKGHALRDYARRTWHGLVAHFYKHRWEIFINHSLNAARKGIDVDPENMKDDIYQFEWNFTQKLADADLTEAPVNGTPVEVMRRMVIKYSPLIQQQADQNASNEGQEKRVKVTPHDFY